jgi:hypothetical protein
MIGKEVQESPSLNILGNDIHLRVVDANAQELHDVDVPYVSANSRRWRDTNAFEERQ